jgi:hypothetical protein
VHNIDHRDIKGVHDQLLSNKGTTALVLSKVPAIPTGLKMSTDKDQDSMLLDFLRLLFTHFCNKLQCSPLASFSIIV